MKTRPTEPLTLHVAAAEKKEFKIRTAMYGVSMTDVLRKAMKDWMTTHPAFKRDDGGVVK